MDRCWGHGDQWGLYGYSLGEACTKTPDSGHDSQATKSEVQKYFSIFFFLIQYLFIYLAASGLNCGTWALRCTMQDLSLQCTGSLVLMHGLSSYSTRA